VFYAEDVDGLALFDELADWVRPGLSRRAFRAELGMRTDEVEGEDDEPIPNSVLLAVLEVVRGSFADSPNPGYVTWLQGFQGALPRLDKPILIPAGRPERASNVFVLQEFSAFMSWLVIGPAQLLRDQLRKSRYLGPLRRIPPRGFEVSLTKSEAAWSDGMAAWEALLTGPLSLVDDCSQWMADADKLATGYSLTRRQFQEFDLSTAEPSPLGRPRHRIALTDAAGLTHQAQDIGVGISQVLPVVVAAQEGSASVVCIEQPELHVHPAIQVGLGDLFIDGAVNKGLSFLIETHSEHLIMRLQRRIREAATAESAEGETPLRPSDVNIVYLGHAPSGAVVAHSIGLDADGKFTAPWPEGFFPERMREALPEAIRERLLARQRSPE
jgi:hypothetical protein